MNSLKLIRPLFVAALICVIPHAFGQNFLVNSGWETGDISGWTTNYPSSPIVESTVVHSGTYAALMPQDYYLDQQFAPIAVSLIQNVSYWIKQVQFHTNPTFFTANILYYSDGTNTYLVPRPANDGGWFQMDLTSDLTPGKFLTGIRVYGVTSIGGVSPKTYFDDFNVGGPVPEPGPFVVLGLASSLMLIRRRSKGVQQV